MLYFLDDIISEIIGRQLPNLFFSKEISDQGSHSQIAVHLYFKGSHMVAELSLIQYHPQTE